MSNEVHRTWFARIKWWDGKVEACPVSKIKKFHPKSLTDFDPNLWYRVKGNKESYSDGVAHSGWALIGLLTETLEEAQNPSRRVGFPPVPPPSTDPDSTATETEKLKEKYNQNTINQQEMTKNLNRLKKQEHIDSFKAFEKNFLDNSGQLKENQGAPRNSTNSKVKENEDPLRKASVKEKENQDKQKIAAMEQKIKQLEEALKREQQQKKRKTESSTDRTLDDYLTQINKVLDERDKALKDSVLEDLKTYQKSVEEELTKINTLLSKSNELSNFKRTKQWVESQSFTCAFQ